MEGLMLVVIKVLRHNTLNFIRVFPEYKISHKIKEDF